MNSLKKQVAACLLVATTALGANAQIFDIVNQGTNMISTALQGGFNYRGNVEASYMAGVGHRRANIFEITSTQGFKYSNWFFMGVGAGLDVMFTNATETTVNPADNSKSVTTTSCMVPLYSDFKFTLGEDKTTSYFFDVRIGASFLIGKNYLQINNGYINRSECFYLKPSIGMRIPVSSKQPKYGFTMALSYSLVSTNFYSYYSDNIYLNGLGFTVGYEW